LKRAKGINKWPIVVYNIKHAKLVKKQSYPNDCYWVGEETPRNTAIAVLEAVPYACEDGDILVVMPADQIIEDEKAFRTAVYRGQYLLDRNPLIKVVAFGVPPRSPSTEYGYIKPGEALGETETTIAHFAEKPDERTAKDYINKGYYWNSGIFMFRAGEYRNLLKTYAPYLLDEKHPGESIDKAIMEKTKCGAVIPLECGWRDIGAHESLKGYLEARKTNQRPWGHFCGLYEASRAKVKKLTITPGAKISLQRHMHRAEHWVIIQGTARITKADETIMLYENESIFIPKGMKHRIENPGKVPLEIIEVQTGEYLGEDDIERFEDVYGRADLETAEQGGKIGL
jgi:mannose-1-phosphate guanylyltransferase